MRPEHQRAYDEVMGLMPTMPARPGIDVVEVVHKTAIDVIRECVIDGAWCRTHHATRIDLECDVMGYARTVAEASVLACMDRMAEFTERIHIPPLDNYGPVSAAAWMRLEAATALRGVSTA